MSKKIIIDSLQDLNDLIQTIEGLDRSDILMSFDTETTGLTKDAEIVGYSLAWETDVGYYVILRKWIIEDLVTKQGKLIANTELIDRTKHLLLLLLSFRLVGHNFGFDAEKVDIQYKIDLMPALHTDTQEMWHLADENNSCALKEVGERVVGEDAKEEQSRMKASVIANGGIWQESRGGIKEMYKADPYLLAEYGAQDAVLTLIICYEGIQRLADEGLLDFFYDEESMPLLKGPTYQMNTTGLKVDVAKLKELQVQLIADCGRLKMEIETELAPLTKAKYPNGFGKKKGQFNIGASAQLSWLLFIELKNEFKLLTNGGRTMAKQLCNGRIPYTAQAKRDFIRACFELNDPKKLPQKFLKCDKDTLTGLAKKYEWVRKLLYYKAYEKIRTTYVEGIQERLRYGVIHPSFLQHGTTSGRYSSKNPNFQNLPKNDKRVKACIIARPGKVFVGADHSQLEPRVFSSVSGDPTLTGSFAKGEDFYSVVGIPIFKDFECSAFKDEKVANSWAILYPHKRDNTKTFALATPYGTTAHQQARKMKDQDGNPLSIEQCQAYMDAYFRAYPKVHKMMLDSHDQAMTNGVVYSLYGRPRRIPKAKHLRKIYGPKAKHGDMPYEARTLLNLAMNHRCQSTAASVINRGAILFYHKCQELGLDARIVLQVHDELVIECAKEIAELVAKLLKECMESITLPGVNLKAEPKIASNLADLK